MGSPFTVLQGAVTGKNSVFLVTIIAPDGDACYLTSKTAYGGEGLGYNGNQYLPRILQNNIDAIQATGPQGYSGVPALELTIDDPDKYIWKRHCFDHGWAGSQITLTVIMWDLIGNAYSTNSLQWSFLGSNPSHDHAAGHTVFKAITSVNFARIKVPSAPVSVLCIWDFPVHYVDRLAGAFDFTSTFYQDGYGPDIAGYYVGNLIAKGTCSALSAIFTATTFTFTSTGGTVPPTPFQATIDNGANTVCEEVLVTNVSGSTWTVLRAQWNTTLASHAGGSNVYVPFTACQLIRSSWTGSGVSDTSVGCMGRLGDYGDTSISPDGNLLRDIAGNYTGSFGGNTWLAPTQYSGIQYTSGQKVLGFNAQSPSLAGTYYNFIYGTQWVSGVVLAPAGDPNSFRSEVIVCAALQGPASVTASGPVSVLKVVVNGVLIPQQGSDALFTWRYIQYPSSGPAPAAGLGSFFQGGRQGAINRDAIYNISGTPGPDPHGSLLPIEVVVPAQLGSIQSVQILATGPPTLQVYPIASISGGVVTFAGPNQSCAGNPPFKVIIRNNSNAGLNGLFELSNWTFGPPGTITLVGTTASGTGGGVFFYAQPDLYDGVAGPACNVVWAYLDLMTWGNIDISRIDPVSWYNAAQIASASISYTSSNGSSQTHARYKASFALNGTSQQVLAGVLTALGNAGNLLVGPNSETGQIQCFIKQTLADQQPSAIAGSNYASAVGSIHADGTSGNGYYAFYFDETTIELGSLKVVTTDLQETPNMFAAQFQDEANGYVVDSVQTVDPASYAFSGNQPIQVPIPILGAPNFDQITRVGNARLAEALYGNPRNDPGGTLSFEFAINTAVIGMASRAGFICGFTWQSLGIGISSPQAVRVLSMKPDTDGEHWQIKCAWHNDAWYTDAYGQNPTPFQNNPLLNPPLRPPYPWQPGQAVTGAFNPMGIGLSFALSLNTGVYPAQLAISGYIPVNAQPTVKPPLVPLQGTTASTGGATAPGSYFVAISANGGNGPVSEFVPVMVPAGTSTNTLAVSGIQWQSGAAADVEVYVGTSSLNMTMLLASHWSGSSNDAHGNPTVITITGTPTGIAGLPDTVFQEFAIIQTGIAHGGVWGDVVTSQTGSTLTFAAGAWTTNQWTGRTISDYYQPAVAAQNAFSLAVSSNTATVLTLAHSSSAFTAGDVCVMRTLATTFSASTIGDSGFVNSYTPSGLTVNGEVGYVIQIIAGTGANTSPKTVKSNTSTVYTIQGTFDITPDATSVFIVLYPTQTNSTTALVTNSSIASTGGNPTGADVLNAASVPAATTSAQSMLIQVATADSNGNFAPLQYQPYREVFVPYQSTFQGQLFQINGM